MMIMNWTDSELRDMTWRPSCAEGVMVAHRLAMMRARMSACRGGGWGLCVCVCVLAGDRQLGAQVQMQCSSNAGKRSAAGRDQCDAGGAPTRRELGAACGGPGNPTCTARAT